MVDEEVSRNEPCPCGSGRKYKRCHGVSAPPKLSTPAAAGTGAEGGAGAGNPAALLQNMDPAALAQMQQALARIPKGQLQRLQGLMQKAMSGKDVSQEAADFERNLPTDLQQQLRGLGMQMMAQQGGSASAPASASAPGEMSEEEAKAIVAAAAAEGKISAEQAEALGVEKKKGLGSLFGFKK